MSSSSGVERTQYFVDDGTAWDGTNQYSVPVFSSITARAFVSPHAQSCTVSVAIGASAPATDIGFFGVAPVTLRIGSQAIVLYSCAKGYLQENGSYKGGCLGGCGDPLCNCQPVPFSYTLNPSQLSEAISTGSVSVSIEVCGTPGSTGSLTLKPEVTLSQSLPEAYAYASATLTFELPNGSPVPGMNVTLTDISTGETVGTQTTNSEGSVTFADLDVGDTFSAEASYSSFGTQQVEFTLSSSGYSAVVTLQCPKGTQFCSGQCVAQCGAGSVLDPKTCQCVSPITTNITTILTGVGIVGAVLLGGYLLVKVVPSRRVEEVEEVSKG